jgi:hypothetical protein
MGYAQMTNTVTPLMLLLLQTRWARRGGPTLRPATSSHLGDSCTAGHSSRYAAMGSDANTRRGRHGRTRNAMGASKHAPSVNAQPCGSAHHLTHVGARQSDPSTQRQDAVGQVLHWGAVCDFVLPT